MLHKEEYYGKCCFGRTKILLIIFFVSLVYFNLYKQANATGTNNHLFQIVYFDPIFPEDIEIFRATYPNNIPTMQNSSKRSWPNYGEKLTWKVAFRVDTSTEVSNQEIAAFIDNFSNNASYKIFVDENLVNEGLVSDLAEVNMDIENQYMVFQGSDFLWPSHIDGRKLRGNHQIKIVVDYLGQQQSTTINSNGWKFDLAVDESVYSLFAKYGNTKTYYFNFLKRNLDHFNFLINSSGASVYPANITIVAQNNLPNNGEHIWFNPSYDSKWGFADYEWTDSKVSQQFDKIETALLHEWGHQIGLIDEYAIDLDNPCDYSPVQGDCNLGIPYVNPISEVIKGCCSGSPFGIMKDLNLDFQSRHALSGLSKGVGYRRGFFGVYTWDVPKRTAILIKVKSNESNIVKNISIPPNTKINFYQTHSRVLSKNPTFFITTNNNQSYIIPNRPVLDNDISKSIETAEGITLNPNPFGFYRITGVDSMMLVEVLPSGNIKVPLYGFFDITSLNLAQKEFGLITILLDHKKGGESIKDSDFLCTENCMLPTECTYDYINTNSNTACRVNLIDAIYLTSAINNDKTESKYDVNMNGQIEYGDLKALPYYYIFEGY